MTLSKNILSYIREKGAPLFWFCCPGSNQRIMYNEHKRDLVIDDNSQ